MNAMNYEQIGTFLSFLAQKLAEKNESTVQGSQGLAQAPRGQNQASHGLNKVS